jgi:histidine ammonia-lyase
MGSSAAIKEKKGQCIGAEGDRRIAPIKLKAKEGLALLNGTQFMSAWGCYSIMEAERVEKLADLTAAISVDAFDAQVAPFHPGYSACVDHKGQVESAAQVLHFLQGSEIARQSQKQCAGPI